MSLQILDTEGSQNGVSLDKERVCFHHCKKTRGKVTKQRQTYFVLSHHSAFNHTVPLLGMLFLSSKHLSEKVQLNVIYPKFFSSGPFQKFLNIIIS